MSARCASGWRRLPSEQLAAIAALRRRRLTSPAIARRLGLTLATEMDVVGPAAGHDRLKTSADSTGTKVLGTINNCAGGKTPWGTVLMAEENFHQYFGGELPADSPEKANYDRYGVSPEAEYPWHKTLDGFDLAKRTQRAEPLRLDRRIRSL